MVNSTKSFVKSAGCGGSIISRNVILTGAHCVSNAKNIYVQMGHSDLNSEEIILKTVKSVLEHPEYYDGHWKMNDIALLRLQDDLTFNKFIHPITLSTEEVQDSFGPFFIFP